MNLIRQRDILKRMRDEGILEPSAYAASLLAPVFLWELDALGGEPSPDEQEFMNQHILIAGTNRPKWIPFPIFRLSYRVGFDLWFGGNDGDYLVFRHLYENDDGPSVVIVIEYNPGGKSVLRFWHDYKNFNAEEIQKLRYNRVKTTKEFWDQQLWQPLYAVRDFLYMLQSPAFTVLRVETPAKPGKSVEWTLARTHYCMVRRSTAKTAQKQSGLVTESDIERAAHWRRSHLRRLISAKFKNKKGTVVQVRQAWVGPREWIGLDKKIYRVQEFKP